MGARFGQPWRPSQGVDVTPRERLAAAIARYTGEDTPEWRPYHDAVMALFAASAGAPEPVRKAVGALMVLESEINAELRDAWAAFEASEPASEIARLTEERDAMKERAEVWARYCRAVMAERDAILSENEAAEKKAYGSKVAALGHLLHLGIDPHADPFAKL